MAFSRRFLLDAGVKATITLPLWMQSSLARAAGRDRATLLTPATYREATGNRLVVIDPGHGGRDPGCIGNGNLYEKDIALSAAWDLRHALQRGGYHVVMTRAHDIFIPLQTRVDIAEKHKAALFLSMHANSVAPDTTVRGASVYTFSNQASDPLAATIASSENSVERISNPTFRGVSPQVGKILFSLMAHSTKIESLLLQQKMVGSLAREVDMLQNPARHATFAVLQSSAIPSVLVETAFLSNPQDEAALRTNAFRQRIAASMKAAVDAWFLARQHAVANL
ncbi:MAG: N-acetylmuramoyl-L-alanine amidase [Acidiphilium sp.]|nr:N-acetylmuramoyl-L-alanine amidase [Acidiphilium sp.]MDD4934375.1 N-acetylmuramoyl-L-alanine amidase [Acidiphilium sp.]